MPAWLGRYNLVRHIFKGPDHVTRTTDTRRRSSYSKVLSAAIPRFRPAARRDSQRSEARPRSEWFSDAMRLEP